MHTHGAEQEVSILPIGWQCGEGGLSEGATVVRLLRVLYLNPDKCAVPELSDSCAQWW